MDNKQIGNMEKYDNYREQFRRLKTALDNGFYLEAIFIEYSMLEDRTESLLCRIGQWESYELRKIIVV